MSKSKPSIGDVIEITTQSGFAYAQVRFNHSDFGLVFQLFPGTFPKHLEKLDLILSQPPLYFFFLGKKDLSAPPYTQYRGNHPVLGDQDSFPLFRTGLKNPQTGITENWWLWDGKSTWLIGPLADDQKNLSIRGMWDPKLLVNRIESGWRPSDER